MINGRSVAHRSANTPHPSFWYIPLSRSLICSVMKQMQKTRSMLLLLALSLAIATIRNFVQISMPLKRVRNKQPSSIMMLPQFRSNHSIFQQGSNIRLIDTLSQTSDPTNGTIFNTTTNITTMTTLPPKTVLYSKARSDRSGSMIQDMLMCHAYAYHTNNVYGGACADWTLPQFRGKQEFHQQLLQAIGLNFVLSIACPPPINATDPPQKVIWMNRHKYISNDTGIFTSDYRQYIQRLMAPAIHKNESEFVLSVHIRRGDITPCRPRTRDYHRYLPNSHYLTLIDRYLPFNNDNSNSNNQKIDDTKVHLPNTTNKTIRVVIYSESQSLESFTNFTNRGYDVQLDGDIGTVWQGLLASDVIILSRSSFSLVPAILTTAKVVYTPFWHAPLSHWDIVDDELLQQTLLEFRRLKAIHCPPTLFSKRKKNNKTES